MRAAVGIAALAWVVLAAAPAVAGAPAWRLDLADTAQVRQGTVCVKDVARGPVPVAAADVVLHAGGRPDTAIRLSRQGILRRLVDAGQAGGVRLTGAAECVVVFTGREITREALAAEVRRLVQPLVPASPAGAPDAWFELELPTTTMAARGDWTVSLVEPRALAPGRNLLRAVVAEGGGRRTVPFTLILHVYGEVGELVRPAERDEPLSPEMLAWTWADLATLEAGLVVGREDLGGHSAARTLARGDRLRESDLKRTPEILAGDPVELRIVRGGVAVSVRAYARQDGCRGQTIPVRNELTGRLVNARVAAPGLVEWRR